MRYNPFRMEWTRKADLPLRHKIEAGGIMEITGKYLLNQAESILRDRNRETRSLKNGSSDLSEARSSKNSGEINPGILESKMLHLQDSLKAVQYEYSRQQTRFAYLTDHPDQIRPSLKYDNDLLFPELSDTTNFSELKERVSGELNSLKRNLKSIQVEMENLVALNFKEPMGQIFNPETILDGSAMKELDPSRVARLTRG